MSVSQQEAKQYCEERGIGPHLGRADRMALSAEDSRMFAWAYSTSDPHEVENIEWALTAQAEAKRRIAEREQVEQLRHTADL